MPKIDESLANIEETIKAINKKVCHKELTPVPGNYSQQSELQKQARFIDKAKRIKQDLVIIEEPLVNLPVNSNTAPTIELLYEAPPWSVPPETPFYFEVRRGDSLLTKVDVSESGHYLLGRLPICDIVMNDETCSRQHAVIQFRPSDPDESGEVQGPTDEIYIYDLGSTSGTYVNGMPLQERAYYPLYPGDILQFGQFPNAFVLREGSANQEEEQKTLVETPKTEKESNAEELSSEDKINDKPKKEIPEEDSIKEEQDKSTEQNDTESLSVESEVSFHYLFFFSFNQLLKHLNKKGKSKRTR